MLASCMQHMRSARNYVIEKPFKPVVILPPSTVIKSAYPINPDHYENTPPEPLELSESKFLKNIDEEKVIDAYIKAISERLSRLGYEVYDSESMSELISSEENAYVFSVAQLEIMEYVDTVRPSYIHNNVYYEQAIDINTIVQNSWIEFSELNNPDMPLKVLFSMQHTADYIDGEYRYDHDIQNIVYEYTRFRIDKDDIYSLNEFSGNQTALYIYDFLMNVYVSESTDRPFSVDEYLLLDRERRMIRKAEKDERFFIIKLKEGTE